MDFIREHLDEEKVVEEVKEDNKQNI